VLGIVASSAPRQKGKTNMSKAKTVTDKTQTVSSMLRRFGSLCAQEVETVQLD
jgi:hypothetical protein